MQTRPNTKARALEWLMAHGFEANLARNAIESLEIGGVLLADNTSDELVCRWVNVTERAVPPEADTIIRTITRTIDGSSTSTTHWLDGLRGPRI